MVKTRKGERSLYLNREERRMFSQGLLYFIKRCYDLNKVEKIEDERFISLHEIEENQFYQPLTKETKELSDIEKIVFENSNFKPFPLIFEEVNKIKPIRRHELQKILDSLEKRDYLSKFILPSSLNLFLHYIEINAKTKKSEMYIKIFPGKLKYNIEENEMFYGCALEFLQKFNRIKEKLEVEEIFGPVEKSKNRVFYNELKRIYESVKNKYSAIERIEKEILEKEIEKSQAYQAYDINISTLAEMQEKVFRGEVSFEKFEEEFNKLLEAVEKGLVQSIEIKSEMFNSLKQFPTAKILSEKNLSLYNDLVEVYNKTINKGRDEIINSLVDFYIKKKKNLDNKNIDLLKQCIKEIIDNIKK